MKKCGGKHRKMSNFGNITKMKKIESNNKRENENKKYSLEYFFHPNIDIRQ